MSLKCTHSACRYNDHLLLWGCKRWLLHNWTNDQIVGCRQRLKHSTSAIHRSKQGSREYREARNEYYREYRKANRDKIQEYNKNYKRSHREEINRSAREARKRRAKGIKLKPGRPRGDQKNL